MSIKLHFNICFFILRFDSYSLVADLFFCAADNFTERILHNTSLVSDWSSLSFNLNNSLSLVIQVDSTSTVIDLPHRLCRSQSSTLITYSTYNLPNSKFVWSLEGEEASLELDKWPCWHPIS